MIICLVSREYPSDDHAGGIGTYTATAARGLARLGQTVYVITESQGEPSISMEHGVVVMRLAPPQTRPRPLWRARAVADAVNRLPCIPDIVQASEYHAEAFWYALHKNPRTKVITRLATPSFLLQELNCNAGGMVGAVRNRYYFDSLERLQVRRSDAVFSLTDALADVVCARWNIPRRQVPTVPNGVDFADRFSAQSGELPVELRDKEYVIYFGRLEERKGVHILGEALPGVLATYPQLHVVFAGNDLTYRGRSMQTFVEECNAPYRHRLHFYPRLPQHQLYPVLAKALFAVLPSLWEALGNVSLEALDTGKPVVATLGSGFSEVIEDGRSGVLVPPGDVPGLQHAIITLLADRDHLSQMGRHAKERAGYFSVDRTTQQLLDFYKSLLGTQKGTLAATTAITGHSTSIGA